MVDVVTFPRACTRAPRDRQDLLEMRDWTAGPLGYLSLLPCAPKWNIVQLYDPSEKI